MLEDCQPLTGALLQTVIEQAARTCKQVQIFHHAEDALSLVCVGVYDGVEDAHLARAPTLALAVRQAVRMHHRPKMLPISAHEWDSSARLIEGITGVALQHQMTFSITCSFGLGMPATAHTLLHNAHGQLLVDVRLQDDEAMLDMLRRAHDELTLTHHDD